jgi:hypothetical protein
MSAAERLTPTSRIMTALILARHPQAANHVEGVLGQESLRSPNWYAALAALTYMPDERALLILRKVLNQASRAGDREAERQVIKALAGVPGAAAALEQRLMGAEPASWPPDELQRVELRLEIVAALGRQGIAALGPLSHGAVDGHPRVSRASLLRLRRIATMAGDPAREALTGLLAQASGMRRTVLAQVVGQFEVNTSPSTR